MDSEPDHAPAPTGAISRRAALELLTAGGVLAASAAPHAVAAADARSAPDWNFVFDIMVRFPAGRLGDWIHFWGDTNVAVLEDGGQWLWGAWHGLTGPQDTATHLWAYRDLAHFQDMVVMRGSNPRVRALYGEAVPIVETLQSALLAPLAYSPSGASREPGAGAVIETRRILRTTPADSAQHDRLMVDYAALAAEKGIHLVGAFASYFGWSPAYVLQVWRHETMADYWAARAAIESDARGGQLLTALHKLHPQVAIELNRPMPYSRIR